FDNVDGGDDDNRSDHDSGFENDIASPRIHYSIEPMELMIPLEEETTISIHSDDTIIDEYRDGRYPEYIQDIQPNPLDIIVMTKSQSDLEVTSATLSVTKTN
ncbi:2493_t:CDS:1, partial [Paraglomus brasilianum]